jgi:peptide/nickel transport system ATP-binding protein
MNPISQKPVLSIKDLSVSFATEKGLCQAVKKVNFVVYEGKTLALVGESGCGKSVTSLAVMRLLPDLANVSSGSIHFNGQDLLTLNKNSMCSVRGNDIAMIFQEPLTALNPVFTIGEQISEALLIHKRITKKQAKDKACELLDRVRIPEARKRFDEYPFQLSGGMKQRALIAMALACEPKILIADEPTTALDVTIQAGILELMKELQKEMNMGIIFITHDLGVVAEIADAVSIMYAGEVIEEGDVYQIFENPRHPYTKGLLESMPTLQTQKGEKLKTIKGSVPNLFNRTEACNFENRCAYAKEVCRKEKPFLEEEVSGAKVACHFHRTIS